MRHNRHVSKAENLQYELDEANDKLKTLEAENKRLKEFIGEDIKNFVSNAFKKEAQNDE